MSVTYPRLKTAMQNAGLPVSSGSAWQGQDFGTYRDLYVPNIAYAAGVPVDRRSALYGVAYPAVMPASINSAVDNSNYSATVAGTPTSGAHPLSVTFTVTETGGSAQSYQWTFGDGNTATTTVPNATHSYAAAGSFTAHVTPVVDGVNTPTKAANVITVS